MKKLILVFGISALNFPFAAKAQIDTLREVNLDAMGTPTTPAFQVMGTSPSEIEKPATAAEFVIAIQNASDNFSTFPTNFGIAFTPFWWTNGKELDFEEEFSSENKMRLWRHLQVSLGTVGGAGGIEDNWRYALGLRTNLLEGKINPDSRKAYDALLEKSANAYNKALDERNSGDAVLQNLYLKKEEYLTEKKEISNQYPPDSAMGAEVRIRYEVVKALIKETQDAIAERQKELDDTPLPEDPQLIKELNAAMQKLYVRYGWKWDLGAGGAYDFVDNKLDSSKLYRAGVWTNFGYSLKGNEKHQWTFLGAARYYYYDQVIYALENQTVLIDNMGAIDAGVRVVLDAKKLSISLEALYRMGLNDNFEDTYKINALANYRFSENRSVYVSAGNDFNETSVGGPKQLRVYIGLNLGYGEGKDILYRAR
ncbi:hypothetical protein [Owenweeksia hongkongensis]|uniref:hypothetical protein n=1 Tax=Owenweeksia hongkongensis TaxID=253245 RepID=UPI003A8E905F